MEKVELGKLLKYEQPSKYIVKNSNYDNKYRIPVLTAGQSFILGYTNEDINVFPKEKLPVIIFDDFTTASKYVDFEFKVKSSAMKILKATKGINIKYVYYAMRKIKIDNQLHKRYWISQFSNVKINVPDLNRQKEIVDKIDTIVNIMNLKEKQIIKLNELIKSQFVNIIHFLKFNISGGALWNI